MWQSMDIEHVPLREDKQTEQKPRRCGGGKWKFWLIVSSVFLILGTAVGLVIHFRLSQDDLLDTGPCVSECPKCRKNVRMPPAEPLPTPDLTTRVAPWFISTNITMQRRRLSYDSNEDAIRVDYAPGRWGSHNGADFKANPQRVLPADSAVLSYSVFFPEDFPWTRGGKLPGFCIGNAPGSCATGSNWQWGAGSLRMMWREGGRGIGYVYLPMQAGFIGTRWATWGLQGSDYKRVASDTGNTGDDVFCKVDGGLVLKAGEWNDVTMVVAMNTPGLANGWISLTVNGETRTTKGVRWRGILMKKVQVQHMLFATFFGGSDSTWSTNKKTYALFKNFKFTAPADLDASTI